MQRKILIVDDNSMNLLVLNRILCDEYEVLEAHDGKEALDIIAASHKLLSAVLLDLTMPFMDGFEVLERMGGDSELAQIPVIVTTVSKDSGSEKRALMLGAKDYITKPYDPDIIRHRLANTIKLRETAAMVNVLRMDSLTGLYNRESFFERAAGLIADRAAGYYIMACVNINNFKVINDQYGSDRGDEVLKRVADMLRRGFNGGLVGRIMADNFAALYPAEGVNDGDIKRILDTAPAPDDSASRVSFSVGLYKVDDLSLSVSAMYDRAAIAEASVKGRFDANIGLYDEKMRERILHEQTIVDEMKQALTDGQFEVWYQPQYNHTTGALIGAEALARWRHPDMGLVSPGVFIPVFERNGFIYELDKYMLIEVCARLRRWMDEGRSVLPVSVNISRYDIFREDLIPTIVSITEKYGIPASLLRLEITESAFAQSTKQIIDVVKRLITLGFTLEIDDFGSGYSSLNTLKNVPAQIVKLDMKFLEDDDASGKGGNIIESVVRMVKWLGLALIAEGVETVEQANYLKSIGCSYVQGYLYAKPMPAPDYERLASSAGKEEKLLVLETVENLNNNSFWDPKSMDTLIFNSYVGGACIFEYHNGSIELLRVTDKFAVMIGGGDFTVDSALRLNWSEYIDEENSRLLHDAVMKSITDKDEISVELKFHNLPGCKDESVYIRSTLRVIARAEQRCLVYSTNDNITAQREAERKKLQAELKERELATRLSAIMRSLDSGVSAAVIDGWSSSYIFANDQFYAMIGYTREQFEAELPHGMMDIIHPDDLERTASAIVMNENANGTLAMEFRVRRRDGTIMWMHTNGSICHIEGVDKPVHIAVHTDITAQKETDRKIHALNETLIGMMNDTPGGFARLRLRVDGTSTMEYCNEGFSRLLRMTREEALNAFHDDVMTGIHPDDYDMMVGLIKAAMDGNGRMDARYRLMNKSGEYVWMQVFARFTNAENGDTTVSNYYIDPTDSEKRAQEELTIHQEEIRLALSELGRIIAEYDINTRTLTIPDAYCDKYGLQPVITGVPDAMRKAYGMGDEMYKVYARFYADIIRGSNPAPIEIQKKTADGSSRWERLVAYTVSDKYGKPVKALIAGDDTTDAHIAYELEHNRPARNEANLLVHALFNISTGETLKYAYRDGGAVPRLERTVTLNGTDNLDELIVDNEARDRYRLLNDTGTLLKRYAEGESEFTIDYRRHINGGVHWVRNVLRLMRKPESDDVLLFEYCYDIEEEKLDELTHSFVINTNYDYVARINGKNRSFIIIANNENKRGILPSRGGDIDELARELIDSIVHPDDRESTMNNVLCASIKRNLQKRDMHQLIYREIQLDGTIRYKKLGEYYLDRELDILLVTCEDVTQIMEEENRKNAALASALQAANQASRAKSEFLSRMSHELRTPMNAIIGLAELSQTDLDKPDVIEGNIAKIGASARNLLSLINDILEMSRIDSGRMTIANELFDFERLISDVNAVINAQAEAKGLDYDVVLRGCTETCYVGDANKLHQILVNVLNNSVKFTERGGKVTLTIEQLRCAGKRATLRFTASDTGSGIDEAFMPYLFDPFAQESAGFTSTSAGTGLGLAITKSMVGMMNGQISVKSLKNVGSVFTIDVQLGLSDESRDYLDALSSIKLDKLRALVVDDDITVCMSTEEMLKTMGIQAEWASSGASAIESARKAIADKRGYSIILIDWKMPEMDGIETTRRLRQIVDSDVIIAIDTAYDWKNIEAEALEAGANLLMEKPLFQTTVVKALQKALMSNNELGEREPPSAPDFTGRRIMLADDNLLNVEVIKRMLEKTGAQVHAVYNGLEALELFATEPDNYFDAILMDVRMPEMDGLTAAKNIRRLKKPGSKAIPIIAVTANAFDEDVELSIANGMSVHLNKPVEPRQLFMTLQRLMPRK